MEKKDRILQAAQELFGKHGYAKTTVKMIADRADVAFGLVAHYFGSKEALFLIAGRAMIDELLETVRQKAASQPNGLIAVREFIRRYFECTMEREASFTILLRCSPFSDVQLGIDRQPVTQKFQELIDDLQTHLEKGMEDGSIKKLPARDCAFVIYGSIVGAVRTHFIAPFDVPGLYGETLRFVMRSIAAPGQVW